MHEKQLIRDTVELKEKTNFFFFLGDQTARADSVTDNNTKLIMEKLC